MSAVSGACAQGLKEWAVLVDALAEGHQMLLLRKGGIADVGGEFSLDHEAFCLWPTYLHQDTDWLRPEHEHRLADSFAKRAEGNAVRLDTFAEVTDILVVPSRDCLDHLADEHVWSDAYLDMRWNYRPELPLYLLLLRAYRLAEPVAREERPEDRGCRSWLTVDPPAPIAERTSALDDAAYERRAAAIRETLGVD